MVRCKAPVKQKRQMKSINMKRVMDRETNNKLRAMSMHTQSTIRLSMYVQHVARTGS